MQCDDRDLACRLRLVLSEHGGSLHLPGVQLIPLLTCEDDGGDVEGLSPDLHGDFWVRRSACGCNRPLSLRSIRSPPCLASESVPRQR